MKHHSVIHVADLHKTFGDFHALDGFDLSVDAGSIHGFLGPNGSGKSTTIRILLGVLHADSGTATILGRDPRSHPGVLKRVGYVPGDVALWPSLSGEETFRALESLRGKPNNKARQSELVEAFQLDPSKRTRDYSTGNRRKVALVAALSCDADVLILDEPTAGLDPLMEQVFVRELRKERDRGATVLLSSHIMSEVEKLCDAVTVIKDGRAVESGSIEKLRHLSSHDITAVVDNPSWFAANVTDTRVQGNTIHITAQREDVPGILREILERGGVDITTSHASLESLFLSHYGEVKP